MGHSLSQNYLHLIFGTKGRLSLINEDIEASLHGYMAGILKNFDSPALKINSVPDHIHILFRLSKNQALAKVIENVKKASSKWMKEKGIRNFKWQIGYAAFSVSSSKIKVVEKYIQDQKSHHQNVSFKEELEKFVKKYEVEGYDPRYFWEDD